MHRLGRMVISGILLISVLFWTGPLLGDEAGDPGENDRNPISLSIEPTENLAGGVGSQGKALLHLTARTDTPPVLLSVQIAGEIETPGPADWQVVAPVAPLIDSFRTRGQFAIRLDGFQRGESRTLELPVAFNTPGYGYLLAHLRSPAEGEGLRFSESFVLYTLTASDRVFFSPRSILELQAQELRAQAAEQGKKMESDDEEILKLKRAGAHIQKSERPPAQEPSLPAPAAAPAAAAPPQESSVVAPEQPIPAPAPPAAAPKSVTISGRIGFTDIKGKVHPVRAAVVQIWDQEPGKDELVTAVTTDRNGNYSAAVNNNDGDTTGRDLYVIALAEGATVRVVDFNDGQVWAIDSLPAQKNTPDGTQLTINLTASNDLSRSNNVAFEAYEAANTLSRYLLRLGEKLPALVTIRYPATGDGSSYWASEIELAGTDVHDWDNIHHEYGHHLQELYNLSASPGGPHSLGENLCTVHGKKNGLLLAWGEAWPTFFSILAQKEMNLASMGIPNLGDLFYTDTKPGGDDLEYNLERSDGTLHGEGDELAIQNALWDLYDDSNDAGDSGVTLSARTLWDTAKKAKAHTLSDLHRSLVNGRSEVEKIAFGAIYAQHKIGSELLEPDDEIEFAISAAPGFKWTGNLGCDKDNKAMFSIRFYDRDAKELLWESSWQTASTFAIAQAEAEAALKKAEPGARWVVASKGLDEPETGIYYGQSRRFRARATEPEAAAEPAVPVSGEPAGLVPGLFWMGWGLR